MKTIISSLLLLLVHTNGQTQSTPQCSENANAMNSFYVNDMLCHRIISGIIATKRMMMMMMMMMMMILLS